MNILVLSIAFGIPFLTWLISYAALAAEFGTWNLLPVKIHESGKYSLRETVFYYNHFLRELPIDTLYALAILWSYSAAGVPLSAAIGPIQPQIAAACLVLFLGWVLIGSVRKIGWRSTIADLFQFRETDQRSSWGSHWQMHFLSTAAVILAMIMPGMLYPRAAENYLELFAVFAGFLALSMVFGTGAKAVLHTRWILHGGREMFTYLLLIILPAFLPLLAQTGTSALHFTPYAVAAFSVLAAITAYHWYVFWQNDLDAHAASKRGFVYLLSSHFFEHVLDCFYILLFVAAVGARA